jgi:hypothetical protein
MCGADLRRDNTQEAGFISRFVSRVGHGMRSCRVRLAVFDRTPLGLAVALRARDAVFRDRQTPTSARRLLRLSDEDHSVSSCLERVKDGNGCMGENIEEGQIPMSKQDEYQQEAIASLKLAEAASNPAARIRMLLMAQSWYKLAARCALPHLGSEHPLGAQAPGSTFS